MIDPTRNQLIALAMGLIFRGDPIYYCAGPDGARHRKKRMQPRVFVEAAQ